MPSSRRRPPARPADTGATPVARLRRFIAKFAPADQRRIRALRAALRRRLPTAHELVYDNYNFFVIGYGATERPGDAIISIAARAESVSLCFLHGARLPDPKRLLSGGGNQVRFLRLESAARLREPAVEALVAAAVARSRTPFAARGKGQLIIRSVSAKQRPRRRQAP